MEYARKIISRRKRGASQREAEILQIAGTHNPEFEELNNNAIQVMDIYMDITEYLEESMIIDEDGQQTESSEIIQSQCESERGLTKDKDILCKREWEKERKRKYREKKKESKDPTKNEDILRKRELAKESSRKYREKKKKSKGLIEDEETLRRREKARERSRKYREKKSRDLTEDEKRELTRERSRKYHEKKDLTQDEEILRIRESGRERSKKYREKIRLEKLNSHDSQIAGPSRLIYQYIH